ncbi:hypothetical protein [Mucilaginibacter sp. NFX135]
MNAISAWLLTANSKLNSPDLVTVYEQQSAGYTFKGYLVDDACWMVVAWR